MKQTTTHDRSAHLLAQIKARFASLCALTDAARISQAMHDHLAFSRSFARYSLFNQMLLALQQVPRGPVAGFQGWKKRGRTVRRGEHGAVILVPMTRVVEQRDPESGDVTKEHRRRYGTGHVFALSQTEGPPVPEAPDWTSPERAERVELALLAFAAANGYTVGETNDLGGAHGRIVGKSIHLLRGTGTKVLLHELVHGETMHDIGDAPRAVHEQVAEAAACIVGAQFGLAAAGSPNYLALWSPDSQALRKRFELIATVSRRLILALDALLNAEVCDEAAA